MEAHKTSLTWLLITEVPVLMQDTEQSRIYVLEVSHVYMCWRSVTYIYVLEVSHVYICVGGQPRIYMCWRYPCGLFFYNFSIRFLDLFQQCGIFCFLFHD